MTIRSVRILFSPLNLLIFSITVHKPLGLIGFDALHLESTKKIDFLILGSVNFLFFPIHLVSLLNVQSLLLISFFHTQILANMLIFDFVVNRICLSMLKILIFSDAVLSRVSNFLEVAEHFVLILFKLYLRVHWPFYIWLSKWRFILQVMWDQLWEVLLFCWNVHQVLKRQLPFLEGFFLFQLELKIFKFFRIWVCKCFFLS